METYNSLTDPHLYSYFSNDRKKDDLKKAGLITKDGEVVSEATYKLNAIMNEKKLKGYNVMQEQVDGKSGRHYKILPRVNLPSDDFYRDRSHKFMSAGGNHYRSQSHLRTSFDRIKSAPEMDNKLNSSSVYRQSTYHQMLASVRNKYPWIGTSPYNWPIPMPHNDILKVRISGSGHKCTGYLTYNTLPAIRRNQEGSPQRKEIQVSGTLQIIPKSNLFNRSTTTNNNFHNNFNNTNNNFNNTNNNNANKPPCWVTMRYYGDSVQLSNSWMVRRDEVLVEQQHCGGNTVVVFKDRLSPGSDFTFVSTRHPDYPFSLTIYVDHKQNTRVSVCCEGKHKKGVRLGGNGGTFGIEFVKNPRYCERCEEARKQRKKDKKLRKKKKMKQKKTKNDGEDDDDEEDNDDDVDDDIDDVMTAMKNVHDDDEDSDDYGGGRKAKKKFRLKKRKKKNQTQEADYDDDFESGSDGDSRKAIKKPEESGTEVTKDHEIYSVVVKSEPASLVKTEKKLKYDEENSEDNDDADNNEDVNNESANKNRRNVQKSPRKKSRDVSKSKKIFKKNSSNINKHENLNDIGDDNDDGKKDLTKKSSNISKKSQNSERDKTKPDQNSKNLKKDKNVAGVEKEETPKTDKRNSKTSLKKRTSSLKNKTNGESLEKDEKTADSKNHEEEEDRTSNKDSSRNRTLEKMDSMKSIKSESVKSERNSRSKDRPKSAVKGKLKSKSVSLASMAEQDHPNESHSSSHQHQPENLPENETEKSTNEDGNSRDLEREAYEERLKVAARQCIMDVYRSLERSMLSDEN